MVELQSLDRAVARLKAKENEPGTFASLRQNLCVSNISIPLSALQREMLWAAWRGELWRDGRGVSIARRRASIVTLRALRERGLVERGGGQVGITQAGEIALELLYTDPREWSTPIVATTRPLPRE